MIVESVTSSCSSSSIGRSAMRSAISIGHTSERACGFAESISTGKFSLKHHPIKKWEHLMKEKDMRVPLQESSISKVLMQSNGAQVQIFSGVMETEVGIEPTHKGLQALVLPLHHSVKWQGAMESNHVSRIWSPRTYH